MVQATEMPIARKDRRVENTQPPRVSSRLPVKARASDIGGMAVAYSSSPLADRESTNHMASADYSAPAAVPNSPARKLQELKNAMDLLKTPPPAKSRQRDTALNNSTGDLLAQMRRLSAAMDEREGRGDSLNYGSSTAFAALSTPSHERTSSPAAISVSLRSTPMTRSWSLDNLGSGCASPSSANRISSFIAAGSSSPESVEAEADTETEIGPEIEIEIESRANSKANTKDTNIFNSESEESVAEINEILARIGEADTSALHCSGPDSSFSVMTNDSFSFALNNRTSRIQHPISSVPGTPQATATATKTTATPSAEEMKRQLDATRTAFYRALEEQQRQRQVSSPLADLTALQRSMSLSGSSLARVPVTFDDLDVSENEDEDASSRPLSPKISNANISSGSSSPQLHSRSSLALSSTFPSRDQFAELNNEISLSLHETNTPVSGSNSGWSTQALLVTYALVLVAAPVLVAASFNSDQWSFNFNFNLSFLVQSIEDFLNSLLRLNDQPSPHKLASGHNMPF